MMVLAEVTADVDFSRSLGQAIFFLILTGIGLFVLKDGLAIVGRLGFEVAVRDLWSSTSCSAR